MNAVYKNTIVRYGFCKNFALLILRVFVVFAIFCKEIFKRILSKKICLPRGFYVKSAWQ